MQPTPPIFVAADDLYVLPSVEFAQSWLEPIDVEPGEKGYDAEGRLLTITVRRRITQGRLTVDQSGARVEVQLAEHVPAHAAELEAVLRDWLGRVEPGTGVATAPLEELVRRASQHVIR